MWKRFVRLFSGSDRRVRIEPVNDAGRKVDEQISRPLILLLPVIFIIANLLWP
ncbi:MAG: hypothetical protein UY72_C0033G0003 [Candidatus Uhrbacteria bacterium GW2011_GWD2_52_7]|uniref:Uncharacterized protein n=1 Tax=Candidatus Uhrbacteria bacterium GW2011_GWD2_52_7 TaxID=1618989 RepID=A0A0G2ABM6_9BACT|nr:MAG: hypothetical protein UY72_C0033G0003 [Candidatus Uhrbacteria bacterium GW2011_GWD2_52_7]